MGRREGGVVDGGFHPQRAAHDALTLLDAVPQVVQFSGDLLKGLLGHLPGGGQAEALLAAQEQRPAQFDFHVLQPLAEGRLGQIELFGCVGQILGRSQFQKDL